MGEAAAPAPQPAETTGEAPAADTVPTTATVLAPTHERLVLSGEELRRVPSQSLEEALVGRLPVTSTASSPAGPGGDVQLRLRGLGVFTSEPPPLYVVDGVPLSDVSRVSVNTLGTSQLERIEVLPGPSAAALYGARASGGVVRITTRRGQAGALQARVVQRAGFSQLARKLGSRTFSTVDEAVAVFGEPAREAFQPGVTYDHEQQLAGRQDLALETLAELSGGSEATRFSVSALVKDDPGLMAHTGFGKQSVRLALDQQLGPAVQLSATAHLLRTRTGLSPISPGSPFVALAATPSFFDLSAGDDGTFPSNPFLPSGTNPLQMAERGRARNEVLRAVGSVHLEAALAAVGPHTLTLGATAGMDTSRQQDTLELPAELSPSWQVEPRGFRLTTTQGVQRLHGQLELRHAYHAPSGALTLRSTAGLQLGEQGLDVMAVQALTAPDQEPSVTQGRGKLGERAAFLHSSALLLDERLQVDAGLRLEQLTLGGGSSPLGLDPMVSLAYRFLSPGALIHEVRPRVAFGEVSIAPAYTLARLDPRPLELSVPVGTRAGLTDLPPERRSELELGVDVVALDGRVALGARAYTQQMRDALLFRSAALTPEGGWSQVEALHSDGAELSLELAPLRGGAVEWTSRTLLGLRRSQVDVLPRGPLPMGGFGTGIGMFILEEGTSPTRIVGRDGLRGDGTCCRLGTLGDAEPLFRMSFQNAVRLGGLSVWLMLDWQQGGSAVNLARLLQDASGTSPDFETAGRARLEQATTQAAAYVEGTSFLEVRELSVSYALPERWYRGWASGVRSAQLSLSARNLLTLTGYQGLDPEVRGGGILPGAGLTPSPPARSFWSSLEVGF